MQTYSMAEAFACYFFLSPYRLSPSVLYLEPRGVVFMLAALQHFWHSQASAFGIFSVAFRDDRAAAIGSQWGMLCATQSDNSTGN